jgi:hypothetical protein
MTGKLKQFAGHDAAEFISGKAIAGLGLVGSGIIGAGDVLYDLSGISMQWCVAFLCLVMGVLIGAREYYAIAGHASKRVALAFFLAIFSMNTLYQTSRGLATSAAARSSRVVDASVLPLPALGVQLGGMRRPPFRPIRERWNADGGYYEVLVYERRVGKRTGRKIWSESVQDKHSKAF